MSSDEPIRQVVKLGDESGNPIPADQVFAEVRQVIEARTAGAETDKARAVPALVPDRVPMEGDERPV